MTVIFADTRPKAVSTLRSESAADLARIHEAGTAATIWQRPRAPEFAAWIDSLPPEQLPRLRALMPVSSVEAAVYEACEAAGLPASPGRKVLAADCAALAAIFASTMAVSHVQLRLDVIETDACRRFHLDRVPARLLCTYRGHGTEFGAATPDGYVSAISVLGTGEAAIFRGRLWPREECGLLHRSPPIAGTGETRLVLVIDVPDDEDVCGCGQPH